MENNATFNHIVPIQVRFSDVDVMVRYSIKETKSNPIPEYWKRKILEFDEDVILK